MWKRFVDVSLGLVMGLALTMNMAISQNITDALEYRTSSFGQLRTILNVNELSFFWMIKYAGMRLVNAPAAERVLSLYGYAMDSTLCNYVNSTNRSDDVYSQPALLVIRSAGWDEIQSAGWDEILFDDNICNENTYNWKPVNDVNFNYIAEGIAPELSIHVIVEEPIPGVQESMRYLAECWDAEFIRDNGEIPDTSLCSNWLME